MPKESYADRILDYLRSQEYQPRELRQLARAMGIGTGEWGDFRDACKALMKAGRIVLGPQNAVMLPPPPGRIRGRFRANPRGFGFVIPDIPNAHGDLYIPARWTNGALTGDTVEATVRKRGKRGGRMIYEGRIVDIVSRGQSRFVGELHKQMRRWFVVPDGNTMHVPIFVGDPGAKGAKPGDQVVVEIHQYPVEDVEARGVIVKVLGPRGEPDVDTQSIVEQYGLPGDFPEEALEEAREAVRRFDPQAALSQREDLRKETVITIDPVDARDFDDAISLRELGNGRVELGVHIADVSYFVPKDGPLDREARARSNSVYLPRLVIPMLPEVLSNGVCSLQEREPRLTKSVFITYDRKGKVRGARMAETVIRSTKRLTYEQATAVLEGKTGRMSAKVVSLLRAMEKLARTIRQRRLREGMLELDLPDVEPVFDDEGRIVDVVPEDTSFSHKIIEMFMVEANEAVARLLTERNLPHLRRVHGSPSPASLQSLNRFLKVLGHPLPEPPDRFALQKLLDAVRDRSESFAVNLAVLRSMQPAEYAPVLAGHYALASEAYCHFTSPIRRYADLTVHRLLTAYLEDRRRKRKTVRIPHSLEELREIGRLCTQNEQRAESAERELKLVFLLRLLEQHVGERFEGTVTGMANVGLFVQLDRFLIDGLLPYDLLGDDWWEVDARGGCAVGERSGYRIRVGDRLAVTVVGVDVATRRVELAPAEPIPGLERARARMRSTQQIRSKSRTTAKSTSARRSRGPTRKRGGSRKRR